jgi:predicted TPR repeat methyltransferase
MMKTPAPPSFPQPDQPLALAEEAHRGGRLEAAQGLYLRAVAQDPASIPALRGLGTVLLQLRQFSQAIDILTHAHRLAPANRDVADVLRAAHNNWANTLQAQGETKTAIDHYALALKLAPDNARTLYNLGVALQSQGRLSEARQQYQKAIDHAPDFVAAWANMGTALYESGQIDDAVHHLCQAVSLEPGHIDSLLNLGLALAAKGETGQATDCAKRALSLPSPPAFTMGLLLAKCGMTEDAARYLSQSLIDDPDDTQGAGIVMASLGLAQPPPRTSDAQLHRLYRAKAQSWDQGTTSATPYRGHIEVAQAAMRTCPAGLVLDAGCGTGLVGSLLPADRYRLEGVDISPAMLEQAKTKDRYDHLECADLVTYLHARHGRYGLITAAATLIHFGDLYPPFEAANKALKPGGWMIFTLFPRDDSMGLNGHAEGGCYQHGADEVAVQAAKAGFTVHSISDIIHEYRHGQPVTALLISLMK